MTTKPLTERPDSADGDTTEAVPSDQRVGQYKLCFELASGGMATVYLGRSEGPAGIERIAAIKRIHPHLAKQESFVEMFLDEARIVSQINHGNVCTVYDFGEADGEYYIAMEYLVGETVSRVFKALRKNPDPSHVGRLDGIALRVIADACEGLHAAHELKDGRGERLGVVHRDVSPQNLFVTFDGVAKVMDFGVALARERLHRTVTGQIKGKYAYMAPEQLGDAMVDRRADVFALGVVLWEALALRPLFKRSTEAKTILNVLNGPIPAPSAIRPGISKELDSITLRALERDPDGRYPTARDFGRDLMLAMSRLREPVGAAEVAEWMGDVFPDGEARRRAYIDVARNMTGAITTLHEDVTGESGQSPLSVGSGVRTVADTKVDPKPASRRRGLLFAGIPLAVAAVLLVVVIVAGLGGGREPGVYTHTEAVLTPLRLGPVDAGAGPDSAPETGRVMPIPEPDAGPDAAGAPDSDAPPTTDRPQPRIARGTGFVSVATPGGWADVSRGGRRLGQTPLRAKLPVGRHSLRLRPFGKGPPRSVTVHVKRDDVARVVVPLAR